MKNEQKRVRTPWGMSDYTKQIAFGITRYGTPSHGGWRLSKERMRAVKAAFPTFIPYAGWPWLEEDCDVAFAVVVFPQEFSASEVLAAQKTIQYNYKGIYVKEMEQNCRKEY